MSEALWDVASALIHKTEQHPFLLSMVNGTLPIENFRYYVIQDALFLADFASCLRMLGMRANDDNAKQNSDRLLGLAKTAEEDEMALHNDFFKKWNIQNAKNTKAMPNTLLYTSYMIRVVSTKSYEEGLAVLLPCFWIYWHVGCRMLHLRSELKDEVQRPEAYDAWIDMYAGEDFEKDVMDYKSMVDVAYTNSDDSKKMLMKQHFEMSCKLEYMFWDQALDLMEWPKIVGEES